MKADTLPEEIKSRIDIVEFISDYVRLKKSGQNYKGLCPFHTEKTPSFMVSPSKQIFHCFGCGTGGDVLSFIMKHENLSFGEAIRYLAKKAGISVPDFSYNKNLSEKKENILHINETAMKFFMSNLDRSAQALAYLKKRGIHDEYVRKFCIGYATEQRDALFRHLQKFHPHDTPFLNTGLILSDGSSQRDLFRKRIMFPILNLKNDVIAFGGRVMDSSLPKYINSPETEVFKKSEVLFGLNLSKEEIRKKDYAIIVEGYLDAIVCHQCGFQNTVAPLGTALTARHIQKLKLLTKKAMLVFDSDEAGISAAKRSLSILCSHDFKAKVLFLPEGEDPDSFLRNKGDMPFRKLLSNAVSAIEFLLNSSKADKPDTVREALVMIASSNDLILADEMLGELADRAKIHETVLRSELEMIKKKTDARISETLKTGSLGSHSEEYLLLSAIISFPDKAASVLSELSAEDIQDRTISSIFEKIRNISGALSIESLLDTADEKERSLITELSFKPGFDLEYADRNISDCLQKLRNKNFEERKKMAEKSGDIVLLDSLLKEKRNHSKRLSL